MADGNAAIKQMNFVDGEWIHGTTVKQQVKVVTDGVPGTAMMAFKDRLSDQEILALAKFVRNFDKKLAAKPGAKTGAKPAPRTQTSRPRERAAAVRLFSFVLPFTAPELMFRPTGDGQLMAHLNVALIGYAFMGRAHSNAYRQVGRFFKPKHPPRMKVLCGRTPAGVKAAAEQLGWEETATDWREVVTRKDIDIVDISRRATATPRSRLRRRRPARWSSARSRWPTR